MRIVHLLAVAALFAMPHWANAQSKPAFGYPARPVRIIVPISPGGPADVAARLIAQKLSQSLGQQFYIENEPGGSGNTGIGNAARATADGYTMLVVGSNFIVNPSLFAKVPYDPLKDFAPVTLMAVSPNILVVNPGIPAKDVKGLIDLIKANPGKYNYASSGIGTTPHLSGEMFKLSQGLDLVHVPFKGSSPAVQSALAGHTPIAFAAMTAAVPFVKDGTLRALAVTTLQRSPALPDVPTLAEVGLTGQEADTTLGILLPAGTPPAVVNFLYSEIKKAVAQPDVLENLAALGFDPVVDTPDEFAARLRVDIAKWAKVIRDANIAVE
jgi:tripartite-type tricarboxylate transporter receptor subunit TctC